MQGTGGSGSHRTAVPGLCYGLQLIRLVPDQARLPQFAQMPQNGFVICGAMQVGHVWY
jgi:hypothetical protein